MTTKVTKMKKTLILSIMALLFLVACAQPVEKIKVGVILPLTGPLADLGKSERQGIELAVNELGKQNIEVFFEDGKADPKASLDAAVNLVSVKNVDYIITAHRGASMSISSGLADQPVVILAYTATTEKGPIGKEDGNFFPIGAEMLSAGRIVGDAAKSKSCTSVGILAEDSPTGRDKSEGFRQGFGGTGFYEHYFNTAETSFKTQITSMKSNKVDCLFIEVKPGTSLSLYKEMVELDFKPKMYGNSYSITKTALQDFSAKTILEGTIFSSNSLTENNETKVFSDSYTAMFNSTPDEFAAMMYDYLKFIKTLDAACNSDLSCVKELIRKDGFSGVSGTAEVLSTGDGLLKEYHLLTVKAGEIIAI